MVAPSAKRNPKRRAGAGPNRLGHRRAQSSRDAAGGASFSFTLQLWSLSSRRSWWASWCSDCASLPHQSIGITPTSPSAVCAPSSSPTQRAHASRRPRNAWLTSAPSLSLPRRGRTRSGSSVSVVQPYRDDPTLQRLPLLPGSSSTCVPPDPKRTGK